MTRTLAALVAVAALSACASGPPGHGGRGRPGGGLQGSAYRASTFLSGSALLFVQFDANKDYVTSRAEAEAGAQAEWTVASKGAATMTPIMFDAWAAQALGGPNIGPHRLAFDSNVNNEITREEFVAAILAKFDKYDADKDGQLHRAEMVERVPEAPLGGPGGESAGGERGERPPGGGEGSPPRRR